MANLEQSVGGIVDAWSVTPTFSLRVTFFLAKAENRAKKSLRQL